ncbi:MAG: hypothetical protein PHG00_10350 [Methylococcales bacterium]|nr:hypothetical protein [Methylococcales bacterium]
MTAYAVKHVYEERGSLVRAIQDFNNIPHSYTSKKKEAEDAARGNAIYVIEVSKEKGMTIYKLGYKFISTEVFKKAGNALWLDRYKYKNTVSYSKSVIGCYFGLPVLIDSPEFNEWFKGETYGMTKIPENLIDELEKLILNPINMAKQFKT